MALTPGTSTTAPTSPIVPHAEVADSVFMPNPVLSSKVTTTTAREPALQSIAKYPMLVVAELQHSGVTYRPGDTVVFLSTESRDYHGTSVTSLSK